MRFPSIALLLFSICALSACEQANRETSPSPIQLEEDWGTALVRRDTVAFGRLLAPGFVYTENASVMNREEIIKSVTGSDTVESARNEGMQVHDFGDVQVITGVLHLRGKGKDGPFDRRFQFTDTWQRRDGRWQVIAAQDYLIPK
jgi:ketosteroid isomerase-like protein